MPLLPSSDAGMARIGSVVTVWLRSHSCAFIATLLSSLCCCLLRPPAPLADVDEEASDLEDTLYVTASFTVFFLSFSLT
jgi:hypothetical protein